MSTNERITADLPPILRTDGKYVLRDVPGFSGLSIWIDYEDDETHRLMSYMVGEDYPATAVEDFDTYVDALEEEMRILRAEFS